MNGSGEGKVGYGVGKGWEQQINRLVSENRWYRTFKAVVWYVAVLLYLVYVCFLARRLERWRNDSIRHFKMKMSRKFELGGRSVQIE